MLLYMVLLFSWGFYYTPQHFLLNKLSFLIFQYFHGILPHILMKSPHNICFMFHFFLLGYSVFPYNIYFFNNVI